MYRILINALMLFVLVVLLAIVVGIAIGVAMNQGMKRELRQFFETASPLSNNRIEAKEIEHFPEVVQRFLNHCQLKGNKKLVEVHLTQKGTFSLSPDSKSKKFTAEQYFRGDEPSFIWFAKFGNFITVKDKYMGGTATMKAQVLHFFTVMNAKDEKLSQGALARYFSEMIWFPSSYLLNDIQWEATGMNTFQGTITHEEIQVTADFEIDEKGALIQFTTDRYMEIDGSYSLEKWAIEVSDYREVQGFNIPHSGRAIWRLQEGDFEYINLEIQDLEFDSVSSH